MRTSAFALSIFALTTLATTLCAENDFAALLADLSFGDPEHVATAEAAPSDAAATELIEDLKPPETSTAQDMVMNAPQLQSPATPERKSQTIAPVALHDPVPTASPLRDPSDPVDFNAVFAVQDPKTYSEIPAQVVCCVSDHYVDPGYADSRYGGGVACEPHVKPVLPSSTLLQYFRSSKFNTHVWDGYQPFCCCAIHHHLAECLCLTQNGKCNCLLRSGECRKCRMNPVNCTCLLKGVKCNGVVRHGKSSGCSDCAAYGR